MLENGPNLQKLQDFAMIPLMLDPLIPLFLLSDLRRLRRNIFPGCLGFTILLKQTSLSAISAANRSQRTDIPSDPIRVSQPFWIHVITTQVAAAHEDTAVQTLQGFLV